MELIPASVLSLGPDLDWDAVYRESDAQCNTVISYLSGDLRFGLKYPHVRVSLHVSPDDVFNRAVFALSVHRLRRAGYYISGYSNNKLGSTKGDTRIEYSCCFSSARRNDRLVRFVLMPLMFICITGLLCWLLTVLLDTFLG